MTTSDNNLRSRPGRGLALPVTFSILILAAGCAHIPVQQTIQYADAFRDVSAVTDELIGDYAAAIDTIAERDASSSNKQTDYPIQFDSTAALTAEAPDPTIAQFQNALRAIDEYNATLLDLANGESDSKWEARAASVAGVVEALGIGHAAAPIGEIARELVSLLAHAHTRAQFEAALTKGAPHVQKLLQGFIDATPDFYRVRVGIVGEAITEVEFKQETVLDELDSIAREYAMPQTGTELALRRAQVESEVASLRAIIRPGAVGGPLPTGAAPCSEDVQARLEEQVRVLRGLCADRTTLANGLNEYHQHLGEYVRLLDSTRGYFDALLNSVHTQHSSDVVLRAHDVSSNAGKLRTEMRAARGALTLPPMQTR